ncbi:hypothetical protein PF005_g28692 [Phytophthora fragariae]|uniref:Uncharacterized protein n=1 Tax=Phytophthora fragariae TaxID=53985 RepID=A0A6A3VIH0_9STRA|nr:hypothetical protein PF003_g38042 [Phytophthora fragariae]KAE8919606.1 hypothetical protein PF009_g30091 [Phytophthora fragariae]KAE9062712.1 hypothetical protein PF010_g29289 [Phytophthora fragariae]KAE9063362.1 hypothetical protein PF007_g29577 [Phytophthora fragariae]KAE9070821.1 hypothetical protein PF006_g29278 [Phytophthora fragariae]
MLHAMAALTGMRSPSDQLCLPSEASVHQDSTPQSQEQMQTTIIQNTSLYRRVMLQEELMVAGHPVLEDVQSALAHVETRAQLHAADMERRFMSSTCGTLADVEARLQNQLEDALRATQSMLEAVLESYDAHARAAQEYSGAAQLQACQAHFSETVDSTRH